MTQDSAGTVSARMAYTFIGDAAAVYEPGTSCPSFFCRSIEKDHDVANVAVSGRLVDNSDDTALAPLALQRTFRNDGGFLFFSAVPPRPLQPGEVFELAVSYDIIEAVTGRRTRAAPPLLPPRRLVLHGSPISTAPYAPRCAGVENPTGRVAG